jgi:hypothetical protein
LSKKKGYDPRFVEEDSKIGRRKSISQEKNEGFLDCVDFANCIVVDGKLGRKE